jgi:hypothetical protein
MASSEESIDREKDVAFYSAVVGAWVETRMERDRSLLALSSAGIGLLVTLLTTVGVTESWQLILYGLDSLAFGIGIVTAVLIFQRNAEYLKQLTQNGDASGDPWLVQLDRVILVSFIFGMVLLAAIGLSSACMQLTKNGG